MTDTRALAEETARTSYGRLLAWLASRTGDVAAAEDALADAFRAALEHWQEQGAPTSPEAWIITTARRKLIDQNRRAQTHANASGALLLAAEEAEDRAGNEKPFPDDRLGLLMACAHPAIDPAIHTPLMLQTVLGLDAARIASAFLVAPKTMGARLVRAKRKIRDAKIPFAIPEVETLPERMEAILDAIYAAFGAGWNDYDGVSDSNGGLTGEAIYLAGLLTQLAPLNAEAWGLFSLMLYAEARKGARRHNRRFVPLANQDTDLWDRHMITKAEQALGQAWRLEQPGRFQFEAAIQSAHTASRLHGRNVTDDLLLLYQQLIAVAPSAGATVSYAAALANANRYAEGLAVLSRLQDKQIDTYQPYWAVRGHILLRSGQSLDAKEAYERAIGLSTDQAIRSFLMERQSSLREN